MDFNLRCDNLKSEIIKIINQSDLPVAVIYYIFQNIYTEVEHTYFGTINSARLKQQKESMKKLEQDIEATKQVKKEQKILNLSSSLSEEKK